MIRVIKVEQKKCNDESVNKREGEWKNVKEKMAKNKGMEKYEWIKKGNTDNEDNEEDNGALMFFPD